MSANVNRYDNCYERTVKSVTRFHVLVNMSVSVHRECWTCQTRDKYDYLNNNNNKTVVKTFFLSERGRALVKVCQCQIDDDVQLVAHKNLPHEKARSQVETRVLTRTGGPGTVQTLYKTRE